MRSLAPYIASIFDRAPAETFDRVELFAAMHLLCMLYLCRWQNFSALVASYEQRLLSMPEDNIIRNNTLGAVYYFWGYGRSLMCTIDGRHDYDVYYMKAVGFLNKSSTAVKLNHVIPIGAWVSTVGAPGIGMHQQIEAAKRMKKTIFRNFGRFLELDILCQGELMFYQGNIRAAESFFSKALGYALDNRLFKIVHRVLFYTMRIAVLQGNYAKTIQALKEI